MDYAGEAVAKTVLSAGFVPSPRRDVGRAQPAVLETRNQAECAICFEPLSQAAVVVLRGEDSRRVCHHFFHYRCMEACQSCMGCPLCRTPYSDVAVVPSLTSPTEWFQIMDVNGNGLLEPRELFHALAATLPVDAEALEEILPALCHACGKAPADTFTFEELFGAEGFLRELEQGVLTLVPRLPASSGAPVRPSSPTDKRAWFKRKSAKSMAFSGEKGNERCVARTLHHHGPEDRDSKVVPQSTHLASKLQRSKTWHHPANVADVGDDGVDDRPLLEERASLGFAGILANAGAVVPNMAQWATFALDDIGAWTSAPEVKLGDVCEVVGKGTILRKSEDMESDKVVTLAHGRQVRILELSAASGCRRARVVVLPSLADEGTADNVAGHVTGWLSMTSKKVGRVLVRPVAADDAPAVQTTVRRRSSHLLKTRKCSHQACGGSQRPSSASPKRPEFWGTAPARIRA
mmetsp:Transcript_107751/g.303586  ORF Transcript_107751/g.303586 Transcript_107751/m.303586 type:complete len:463 (+) Transcript_107751:60-1448(+)